MPLSFIILIAYSSLSNKHMKNFVLVLLVVISSFFCNAQHLSYSDFMYFSGLTDDGQAMLDYMSLKGYELNSFTTAEDKELEEAQYTGEEVAVIHCIWFKNGSYDSRNLKWIDRFNSVISLELLQDFMGFRRMRITYLCPNKEKFTSFKETAKQDGFKQKSSDEISESLVFTRTASRLLYAKYHSKNEWLIFSTDSQSNWKIEYIFDIS